LEQVGGVYRNKLYELMDAYAVKRDKMGYTKP